MNAITSRFTSRKIPNNSRGNTTSQHTLHAWRWSYELMKKKQKKTAFEEDEKSAFHVFFLDASASQISIQVQKIS